MTVLAADPGGGGGLTQAIMLTFFFITGGGTDMQPTVNENDFVIASSFEQAGLVFDDIKVGDIIVMSQLAEPGNYAREHYVSRVTEIINEIYDNGAGEMHTRQLLVTQGDQDPTPVTNKTNWIEDPNVVHVTEFWGKVLGVQEVAPGEVEDDQEEEEDKQEQASTQQHETETAATTRATSGLPSL